VEILHSDSVFQVPAGTTPNYNKGNSLVTLLRLMEQTQLAVDREWYLRDHLQYLFPVEFLELYGPSGGDAGLLDPARQDNKTDFQKQNVKSFRTSATSLVRGWVTTGDWTGPFLRLSYLGGPDSPLWKAKNGSPGESLKLWLKVGSTATSNLLTVPYNERADRYEIELWGFPGDLKSVLGGASAEAVDRHELQANTELIRGDRSDFQREKLNDRDLREIASDCTMHPILPLSVECAWADADGKVWDSNQGRNYRYVFSMVLRGWDHFLGTGISPNPHGGIGFLEYRNLMSNYGRYAGSLELGRSLEPWNFNAFGTKNHGNAFEPFMSVDYMDLHILKPDCGIGMHRHRDNQEIFLMLEGRAFMVVGDWCKMPDRQRSLEIRSLRAGHFAMLKGGNLHGLMNATDEDIHLFMFGGYD
jgi:mannose-6-phosphate isomerase-like protein (cupin superfamily)